MADTDFITRHDAQVEYCKLCGICKTPGKKENVENACIQSFQAKNPILEIPAADVVEVVRCKNCKHRPVVVNPSRPYGFGLAGPGSDPFGRDETCPYLCDDGYYNRMPDDDGFCNFGEVKDG